MHRGEASGTQPGRNNGSKLPISSEQRRREGRKRLPDWFRTSLPTGQALAKFNHTRTRVRERRLNTVCEEARCPNVHDCWGRGTATFMVGGDVCTRACRFCAVGTAKSPHPLSEDEPKSLAIAVAQMEIEHAVITVVNRDDIRDGGADHFRRCVQAVHDRSPEVTLELLSSDLGGDMSALSHLLDSSPLSVFAHNVECVPSLDGKVRDPRASFDQSIAILREAKILRPDILTKSGLMVGIGERDDEVVTTMERLRDAGVDLLTIGQYLQPSWRHLEVERFVRPEQFEQWYDVAMNLGFKGVASGPLVRSSFRAGTLLRDALSMRTTPTEGGVGCEQGSDLQTAEDSDHPQMDQYENHHSGSSERR